MVLISPSLGGGSATVCGYLSWAGKINLADAACKETGEDNLFQ